jgi:hypothetical protein
MESGYSLEIDNWGNWNRERVFTQLDEAKRYGYAQFSQNLWRILDRITGLVVFTYDPFNQLQLDALRELQRFETTDYFRRSFQPQWDASSDLRELRSTRRRLNRRNEEILRLSMDPMTIFSVRDTDASFPRFLDMTDEEESAISKFKVKINWKSEGF